MPRPGLDRISRVTRPVPGLSPIGNRFPRPEQIHHWPVSLRLSIPRISHSAAVLSFFSVCCLILSAFVGIRSFEDFSGVVCVWVTPRCVQSQIVPTPFVPIRRRTAPPKVAPNSSEPSPSRPQWSIYPCQSISSHRQNATKCSPLFHPVGNQMGHKPLLTHTFKLRKAHDHDSVIAWTLRYLSQATPGPR